MLRISFLAKIALIVLVSASHAAAESEDLYFEEAIYYAKQGRHFDALARLDTEIAQHRHVDEPALDSLHPYMGQAEFSVGDFELRYRMHQRAGRAIRAVIEGDVAEPVRNDAVFRLARIFFQKGQPRDTLRILDQITGEVPDEIRGDVEFLRANALIATGQPELAVAVLSDSQPRSLTGFTEYNLGIALLQDGRPEEAIRQLDRAGRVTAVDRGAMAIRDKSNLVLGTLLFEAEQFEPAQASLDRVRLEGPYSNQALLRAGWADVSAQKFDRALVPWGLLVQRDTTDEAVQEALLALPYAYGQLNVHGRAATLYGRAVDVFAQEIEKLDSSVESIRSGEFLDALVRDEIREDRDWVVRLRSLPNAPETFYLIALMASHEFQTALQNYLDLEDLRSKLVAWQRNLDSFEDIIALRRAYYEGVLPETDPQFRKLDAQVRLRLEQREHLADKLENLLIVPRPESLSTSDEQRVALRLDELESQLGDSDRPDLESQRARIARLRGVLKWNVESLYHERLTDAHRRLRELTADVDVLRARYEAFVRARQAATHSYVGYETPIKQLRTRVDESLERVERIMARQGRVLEVVAIDELDVRRDRLEAYHNQARFAFADSYDRAAKQQALAK